MNVAETQLRAVDGRYGRVSFFVTDDGAVGPSLAMYGEWAENELAFMRHFIQEGATVLDVGGYIGTHTLAFARAVGPRGRVFSFEAQPLTFDVLQRNVMANRLANVEVRNAVVADFIGTVGVPSIDIEQRNNFGSATLRAELLPAEAGAPLPGGSPQRLDTPAISIDSLNLQACALIKIDVEGAEDVVLRGAEATISRLRPVIYAECNTIEDGLRSSAVLRSFGYEVRLHVVDAFNEANYNASSENIFGRAREAALLGIPQADTARLEMLALRPCEQLVKVETADDLALGLLNKPQYPAEILAIGAAAHSGGDAWLHEITQLQADVLRINRELGWTRRALDEAARDREVALAQMEAAMRQAHAARAAIDAARAQAAKAGDESEGLRTRLEALLASTSWRITQPMRTLSDSLRRRR